AKPVTALRSSSISMVFNKLHEGGFRHLPIVNEMEELTEVLSVKNLFDYLAQGIISDIGKDSKS
ncbi:MAG: hypothetical protein KDD53_10125, partial [Bdellovibrionales bacterium]|nr:hypothetical protein [Bdellovibrionales bacterium]